MVYSLLIYAKLQQQKHKYKTFNKRNAPNAGYFPYKAC